MDIVVVYRHLEAVDPFNDLVAIHALELLEQRESVDAKEGQDHALRVLRRVRSWQRAQVGEEVLGVQLPFERRRRRHRVKC
uniref:Uncharacterized protein n=1 Tax=Hyaloperonospora arabidopsidis (strain Emoy2) TaxID=559515 RepID=M4BL59_HYAAE